MLTRLRLGLEPGDVALLSVGDLNENKNHSVLVEALAMFPPNYKLLIAGEGSLRSALEEKALRLGLEDRVKLLGFRKDVVALLNACDLFASHPSAKGCPSRLSRRWRAARPVLRQVREVAPTCWDRWHVARLLRTMRVHGPMR